MIQSIKQDLRIYGKDNWVYAAFLGGGFLIGQLMLFIILKIVGETGWFPMSTLMAALGGAIALILSEGIGFRQRYMIALSMGRSRKPVLGAELFLSAMRSIIVLLLIYPLARLDAALYRGLYYTDGTDDEIASFILQYITPQYLLIGVVPLVCIGFVIAAIYGKFGKKGGLILYLGFMVICFGLPRAIDLMERYPKSAAGQLLAKLASLPPALWIVLAAAILLIALCLSVCVLLRLQVDID